MMDRFKSDGFADESDARASSESMEESDISFILTGFGPFGKISLNPTTEIIKGLTEKKDNGDVRLSNVLKLKIVHTSAESVRNEVEEIVSYLHDVKNKGKMIDDSQPSSASKPRGRHIVLIHFGVNHMKGRKAQFQLEQNAYNEANFRIPDEDGYQPKKSPINEMYDVSLKLCTDLNVKRIKTSMENDDASKGLIGLSGDAGRFVCNFLYWTSLCRIQEEFVTKVVEDKNDGFKVHVLFVHVPSFEQIPHEKQEYLSIKLLASIEAAILAKEKKERRNRK
jgi:pyroglutamyl-peptidase